MKFRNRETTEVITLDQLRTAFPAVYFPEEPSAEYVAGLNYDIVNTDFPTWLIFDRTTSYLAPDGVEFVNDEWREKWTIKATPAAVLAERLAAVKVAKIAEINAWRDEANSSHFTHMGKRIAVDAMSTKDLTGTAGYIQFFGELPPDWPGGWKTMDNSYIAITSIEGFKALYASMVGQGTTNFMRSQFLKSQVQASASVNQINAITWS